MNIQQLRTQLEQSKGRRQQIKDDLKLIREDITQLKVDLIRHEKALEIVREVGLKTQQQLQYHISDITSLALEAIFDNPYTLVVEFVQRRGKTECDLYFERDGEKVDPLLASGGGTVDVAAFALRIASWSMMRPRTRNVMMLDEPLRFVSAKYQEKASAMIKEISEKLGIQFIIVTHNEVLASYADKTFEVTIKKGVSHVRQN
jgi:DNA repair exonuclease SbcCD ATPase subunit